MRRFPSASIVWGDDVIPSISQRSDDMTELIRSLRETVNKEDGAFDVARCGLALDIVNPDFRISNIQPCIVLHPAGVIDVNGVVGRHLEMA